MEVPISAAAAALALIVMAALWTQVARLRALSEKEHEISQFKSDMASFANHEIINALTSLQLCVTLLRDSEEQGTSEERMGHYAILDRIYTHMSTAAANFLNMNQLETGRLHPFMEPVLLQESVRVSLAEHANDIQDKDLSLIVDLPEEPLWVLADAKALMVILDNLLGNALKYTPPRGTIAVRARLARRHVERVLISIQDSGVGISRSEQERIFTGFYRSPQGQRAAHGYGIGLKVTRQLLESQGSRLGVKSEVGEGSRFFFSLQSAPSLPVTSWKPTTAASTAAA